MPPVATTRYHGADASVSGPSYQRRRPRRCWRCAGGLGRPGGGAHGERGDAGDRQGEVRRRARSRGSRRRTARAAGRRAAAVAARPAPGARRPAGPDAAAVGGGLPRAAGGPAAACTAPGPAAAPTARSAGGCAVRVPSGSGASARRAGERPLVRREHDGQREVVRAPAPAGTPAPPRSRDGRRGSGAGRHAPAAAARAAPPDRSCSPRRTRSMIAIAGPVPNGGAAGRGEHHGGRPGVHVGGGRGVVAVAGSPARGSRGCRAASRSWVSRGSSASRASPKSMRTGERPSISTLVGLMSRCSTPTGVHARHRLGQAGARSARRSSPVTGPSWRTCSCSERPGT